MAIDKLQEESVLNQFGVNPETESGLWKIGELASNIVPIPGGHVAQSLIAGTLGGQGAEALARERREQMLEGIPGLREMLARIHECDPSEITEEHLCRGALNDERTDSEKSNKLWQYVTAGVGAAAGTLLCPFAGFIPGALFGMGGGLLASKGYDIATNYREDKSYAEDIKAVNYALLSKRQDATLRQLVAAMHVADAEEIETQLGCTIEEAIANYAQGVDRKKIASVMLSEAVDSRIRDTLDPEGLLPPEGSFGDCSQQAGVSVADIAFRTPEEIGDLILNPALQAAPRRMPPVNVTRASGQILAQAQAAAKGMSSVSLPAAMPAPQHESKLGI